MPGQLADDTLKDLNETATSLQPIPHNLETPRINITNMGDDIIEVEEIVQPKMEELIQDQLQKVRKMRHDEFWKGKSKAMSESLPLSPEQEQQQLSQQQPSQQLPIAESNTNYTWDSTRNTDTTSVMNLENIYRGPLPKEAHWKEGTTLIIGDSMIGGIDESRLRKTKVRVNPGATVEDMFYHITPYLRKHPSNIICHIGTNNAVYDSPEMVMSKLIRLKEYILSKLPNCKLYFSSPIIRRDNTGTNAIKVVEEVISNMFLLETPLVNNGNIGGDELGKRGLHLNGRGTGKLAVNFINILKSLQNP